MNENIELLEHIYKDAEMSVFTLSDLLDKLKDKDNKIKGSIEDILHTYESFLRKSKEQLDAAGVKLSKNGMMAKMGASMGIKKEVQADNSDSSMADMLIKGISMGSIDMEKKIKDYEKEVDSKELKLAQEFFKFQQNSMEKLKKYL